jgi:superfamily II DNA or RNA helicase
MLDELKIEDTYSSESNDLVEDFYNPALECAVRYDRITGYFSPKVLAVASRGFAGLIKNDGEIRIITSVEVDSETYELISKNKGLEFSKELFPSFEFDINELKNQLERDYLAVFLYLYNSGKLKLKIAATNSSSGIMHQKIGIIRDKNGGAISFSGSNNETVYGWSHNLEEFKVFKNWRIASSSYFKTDDNKFEKYWSNEVDDVIVMNIDKAIQDQIVSSIKIEDDLDVVIERIKQNEKNKINKEIIADKRVLFDYQKEAISHWESHSYKSIFEMATGTGKTFTSINALKQFRAKNRYLHAIVVVPLTTLTIQWQEDIKQIIENCAVINTSTSSNWRLELQDLHSSRMLGSEVDYIIVTTYSMFAKNEFTERILALDGDIILVADEMHNIVNENRIKAANSPSYKYKLGLSATPTRLWRQVESRIVAQLFGDNRFTYDISEAIKKEFLVPFYYYPIPINLTEDEYEKYLSLSLEISRLSFMKDDLSDDSAYNMKLIARSRIKKNAENKLPVLESMMANMQTKDELYFSLIYVDNEKYLEKLQNMLTKLNIRTTKFIGSTALARRLEIIDSLRSKNINAIVAIKCLDEGVDIPSAKNAFFMSNNTDQREYVQRLGRVLRVDRDGDKKFANVYDYLIMPPNDVAYSNETNRNIARNLVRGELIRANFFESLALNAEESKDKVADAVDKFGFFFKEDELEYEVKEDL